MEKGDIFIAIFIITLGLLSFGAIRAIGGFQDNYNEYLCSNLKISVITGSLDDIDRMEENKQLCNNDNCTNYFNKKIKNKLIIINDTLEGKHCERFGFVLEGES